MHLHDTFQASQRTSRALGRLPAETIAAVLLDLAAAATAEAPFLLAENEKDLARMSPDDPKYDRLQRLLQQVQ